MTKKTTIYPAVGVTLNDGSEILSILRPTKAEYKGKIVETCFCTVRTPNNDIKPFMGIKEGLQFYFLEVATIKQEVNGVSVKRHLMNNVPKEELKKFVVTF